MNKNVKTLNETQPLPNKEVSKETTTLTGSVYMAEKQESFLIDGISAIAIHNGVARLQTFRFSAGPAGSVDSIEFCIPVSAIKQVVEVLNKVK